MPRASHAIAALAVLLLAGCSKLPSDYHGRWYCGQGTVFELSASKVTQTGEGRSFWSAEIKSVDNIAGGKLLRLDGRSLTISLKREGRNLRINGASCLPA